MTQSQAARAALQAVRPMTAARRKGVTRLVISYETGADCDTAVEHTVPAATTMSEAQRMARARLAESLHGCVQVRRQVWTGYGWSDAGLIEEV